MSGDCPKRKDIRVPVNIVNLKNVNGDANRWEETVRHFGYYLSNCQIHTPKRRIKKSVKTLRDTALAVLG